MRELTKEQKLLREMIREFTSAEIAPRDRWMDENGFDAQLHAKMASAGIFGIPIDEKYGGAGFDFATATMVIHEVAKGSGSVAINLDSVWLGCDMLEMFGTEAQKAQVLPQVAKGAVMAFALTEPGGGSDAVSIRSRACRQEDGSWILNGSKAWITNFDADFSVVIVKTDPNAGARGMSAFIVPKTAEGVVIGTHEDKSGLRGSNTGEISFDHVHLPAEALLGEEGKGFKYAMAALDSARISIAAVSLGIAQHATELAKNYANERIAFGRPVSQFEGIQFKFADMVSRLHCMELTVYDTADLRVRGLRHTQQAAITKLVCTGWATQICLEAQQVFGGNGCSREFHVERLVRDAKINEIAEGTSEIQRMVIGRGYLTSKQTGGMAAK